jgi:hypothetical protein
VASAIEVLGADGALQGATSIEVVVAGPRLGDSAWSLLQDLVARGADAGVPESAPPGDIAPTPGSSSVMGLRIPGMYLPGSPGSPPHPSIGDGWGTRHSLCVHRLPSRRGCYMRR